MEELKTTSTSSLTSRGGGRGEEGDVVESANCKQQLSPTGIVDDDDLDLQRKMEQARLNQDLVFSIELITDKIWSHLNFADLKATREVSREFFHKINSFKEFQNFAVLIISKESLEIPHLFDKKTVMTQTWLGIQIDVDLPLEVLDKIRHILQNVQFISFVTRPGESEMRDVDFTRQSYGKFIASVLSSTPKCTSLKMDIRFFLQNLSSIWCSSIIRGHLKNLEALDLPHGGLENQIKLYGTNNPLLLSWKINFRHPEFARNFEQLAKVLETTPRLKSLHLTKYLADKNVRENLQQRQIPPITTSFLDLFQRHHETLVEVSIPLDVWKYSSEELATVIMPHLKSLTAVVYCDVAVQLQSFLRHHPKLEQLECRVLKSLNFDRQQAIDMWEVIKRRCSAAAYLKKLHLELAEGFMYWSGANDEDWNFLEGMRSLEDFQLGSYQGSLGSGTWLLEALPRNQLKRLSLNDMGVEKSFWRYCSPEGGEGPVAVTEEVPLATKLELFRGFQNLKRLSFRHSWNAVDDDVIQFIFREMNCLEELEVSHCFRLTDVGLAGTGPEKERVSIRKLQDLKLLSIRACPSVTPEGLLSVLALPFLQHFEYYTRTPVPKWFVRGISAQNPSLETISVHTSAVSDVWDMDENKRGTATSSEEKKASSSSFSRNHPWISALFSFLYPIPFFRSLVERRPHETKDFHKETSRIKAVVNLEKLGWDRQYQDWEF